MAAQGAKGIFKCAARGGGVRPASHRQASAERPTTSVEPPGATRHTAAHPHRVHAAPPNPHPLAATHRCWGPTSRRPRTGCPSCARLASKTQTARRMDPSAVVKCGAQSAGRQQAWAVGGLVGCAAPCSLDHSRAGGGTTIVMHDVDPCIKGGLLGTVHAAGGRHLRSTRCGASSGRRSRLRAPTLKPQRTSLMLFAPCMWQALQAGSSVVRVDAGPPCRSEGRASTQSRVRQRAWCGGAGAAVSARLHVLCGEGAR